MSERLCKDCAYARHQSSLLDRWVCTHQTAVRKISNRLVTGEQSLANFHDCSIQRGYECGAHGKYWTPAVPTIDGEVVLPAIAAIEGPEEVVLPPGFVTWFRRAFSSK